MIRFWSHTTANFSDTHYQWKIVCKSPASRWLSWCSMSAYHVGPQVGFYRYISGRHSVMIICCLQLWIFQPVKTADTSWCHPGFPMKWHLRNKRRNSILMTYHYPDQGRDKSSVKKFCACSSDIILQGKQQLHRKVTIVSSGYEYYSYTQCKNNFRCSKGPTAALCLASNGP